MCIFLFSVNAGQGAEHCPDSALLKEIGLAISSHEQCVKLALELKICDDDLYKLDEALFTDTLAHEMLLKWVTASAEKATGSVLHTALCNAERQDLADRFEDRLFGRGKTFVVFLCFCINLSSMLLLRDVMSSH